MPTYAALMAEAVWRAQFVPPLRARLMAGVTVTESGCWLWPYGLQRNGYGRISVANRRRLAHRVAYEVWVGPIPEGLDIDHLCRTRNCINPDHLETVTHRENVLRGETIAARNASVTHCPRGHPYDEANTYRRPGGTARDCKRCKLDATARCNARGREREAA